MFALARESNPVAALAVPDAPTTTTATFDQAVSRIQPATGRSYLEHSGRAVIGHRGLSGAVDLVQDERVKRTEQGFAAILELELALHDRSPYKDVARAWQLVARRLGSSRVHD